MTGRTPAGKTASSRSRATRAHAASEALSICQGADGIAQAATAAIGVDDERLFALLEQRERMLAGLAEHIVTLKLNRTSADDPLFAASERVVDDADAVVARVCEALSSSHRTTVALAMRVAERVAVLRDDLANVQRAGNAGSAYAAMSPVHQVDRFR
jgi:hypothetical protein